MKKITQKTCRQCGKTINPSKGRSDRIYCDEKCKNQFHNAKAIEENAELQRIELILRKNRRILKKMFLKKERDEINKEKLLKEGFDFNFHTHHITTKIKKNEFIFCFDFGYRSINADTIKIVKAFDNNEN